MGLTLLFATSWPRLATTQTSPRMVAYIKVGLKVPELEAALRKALPSVEVTVLGRLRDFQHAVEHDSPQMALAPRAVLDDLGLAAGLQGTSGGSSQEEYVVLSSEAINVDNAANYAFGMVDLLGRKKMPGLVATLLGEHTPKKVERVTKEEDLMGLLQFKMVDAILVRRSAVERLRQGSQMDLVTTSIPSARLGLPAVWFASDAIKASVAPSLAKLEPRVATALGVDGWQ